MNILVLLLWIANNGDDCEGHTVVLTMQTHSTTTTTTTNWMTVYQCYIHAGVTMDIHL
jgi:hypothetical protein